MSQSRHPAPVSLRCRCGHIRGQHCNGECLVDGCACEDFRLCEIRRPAARPSEPLTGRELVLIFAGALLLGALYAASIWLAATASTH